MDRVDHDTQPTPRPRPVKRPAARRAAVVPADPRVDVSEPPARRRNGNRAATSRAATPEPLSEVDATVDLPSPVLPQIVPAELDGHDEPVEDEWGDAEVVAPPFDPVAPGEETFGELDEPALEPLVTFVDPATLESVTATPARPAPRRSARPRVRRVTRVVRHVDTWSVFKVALVFNLLLYAVCLTSGVLLWNVASATGTIDNVERFFEQFGWSTFEFHGGEIFHSAWIGGLFVVVGLTGFAVLLATVFNLITDLVGGIRVTVLEEEVVARSWNFGSVLRRDDLASGAPVADDVGLPDRVPLHPF